MGKILGAYIMPHPPVIVPEIGRGKEKEISETIDSMIRVAEEVSELKPDTIIMVGPHGALFRDAVSIMGGEILKGDFRQFGAKEVGISKENDIRTAEEIDAAAWEQGLPSVLLDDDRLEIYQINRELEHDILVPLYFIEKKYQNYQLVAINYGLIPREKLYKFGMTIKNVIEELNKNVVIIASGDLSHKLTKDAPAGYNESGAEFDKTLTHYLLDNDTESILSIGGSFAEEAGECGLRSIDILLGTLDGSDFKTEKLSYEGPFGVGYGVFKFVIGEKNSEKEYYDKLLLAKDIRLQQIRSRETEYVQLARKTLEEYVLIGNIPELSTEASEELRHMSSGVFVSIKKDGELRGCIGTIQATKSTLGEEIISNAIKAGTQDPRFEPVDKEELDQLVYSVDVLSSPEEIEDIGCLDPKRYGVIVQKDGRSGLLLPILEGIDTVEQQINIALQKGGISPGEKYKKYRFEVVRYK